MTLDLRDSLNHDMAFCIESKFGPLSLTTNIDDGVSEQGAGKDVWTKEEGSNRKPEETAQLEAAQFG